MAEDVLRELGHIIVGLLPLRNIVFGTFRVDRHLHSLSLARVAELWPRLAPLLVAPFLLSRQDLLPLQRLRLETAHLPNGAYRIGDPVKKLSSAIAIGALPNLTKLQLLHRVGDDGIISLSNAIKPTTGNPMGALPQLEELDLNTIGIGDVGMQAFASAIANGALPNLEILDLRNNQISDPGMASLSDAVSRGALANLSLLNLEANKISDAGMISLSEAFRSGSLQNLTELGLFGNNISDAGMISFAEAVRSGALPNLDYLDLQGNPISDPGMTSLYEILYPGMRSRTRV
jgi:Leucine-rich repeat (LRR) protein